MKKNTVCFLTLIAFLASAHAAIIEFTEDFSGGPNWGFDSAHANGAGDTADIGGSGAVEIAATGYTHDDAVYLQKNSDNSGAASETGSFRVNMQVNPWSLTPVTGQVFRIMEVVRFGGGNTSAFSTDGILLQLNVQKLSPTSATFWARSATAFGSGTFLSRSFAEAATDSDGFIDISLDLTLSADGNDWTYDLDFNSVYNGVTAGETVSNTRLNDTNETGIRSISGYRLGLDITNPTSITSGGLIMDNFEVTVIPEPSSLLLLLGAVGAFFLFRRRV